MDVHVLRGQLIGLVEHRACVDGPVHRRATPGRIGLAGLTHAVLGDYDAATADLDRAAQGIDDPRLRV